MSGAERCPECLMEPLVARTNGFGSVYLECRGNCGYHEGVYRKADPFPTIVTVVTDPEGRTRERRPSGWNGKRFSGEAA